MISCIPTVELGGFGFNSENKMWISSLKVDFLRSISTEDLTTIVLKSSMKEKSFIPLSTNDLSFSM